MRFEEFVDSGHGFHPNNGFESKIGVPDRHAHVGGYTKAEHVSDGPTQKESNIQCII